MDLSKALAFIVSILTTVAPKTGTKVDDALLDLLTALQNSPPMLLWLQNLLTRTPAAPAGTLPAVAIDESDPELQAAWKNSPHVQAWFHRHHGGDTPPGTEPIGLGGIAMLIKFLPQILALLKLVPSLLPQIQQFLPQIQELIALIVGLLKPTQPTT